MSYPNFALDGGDLTNSRPVLQLRVAQGAILDTDEDRERESHKSLDAYRKPYKTEAKRNVRGCIPGEVALKKRRTGKAAPDDDIYGGPIDPKLDPTLVPHFSHLNQLNILMPEGVYNKLADEEKRCMAECQFQIAGIVGTVAEPQYEGKELGKNDFVVEIGGVRSIINNNPSKTILQGQLVMARAPDPSRLPKVPVGTDPEKILVQLEPFDPSDVVSRDTIKQYLALDDETFYAKFLENRLAFEPDGLEPGAFMRSLIDFFKSIHAIGFLSDLTLPQFREPEASRIKSVLKGYFIQTETGEVNKATLNLMNSYHRINHHVQSHVLGIAMSDGPPNTRFDIKIGSYAL